VEDEEIEVSDEEEPEGEEWWEDTKGWSGKDVPWRG
jgi:hypothetical protein